MLIVDDDEGTRETLGPYLSLEGYSVHVAATGAEAMRIATTHAVDVILLDYHLDDTDGLTWLREARERDIVSCVLLITADMEVESRRADIEALNATPLLKLMLLDDIVDAIELQFAA